MPWYIIYGIFTHKWFLSAVGINTIMQGLRCSMDIKQSEFNAQTVPISIKLCIAHSQEGV